MPDKPFKIPAADMKPLAKGRGCLSSPRPRLEPQIAPIAQIWNSNLRNLRNLWLPFFAPANIPLLDSPAGSAFERSGLFKKFVAVPFEAGEEEDE